jgi:uncharacterized membrane protein (Fun14 family)
MNDVITSVVPFAGSGLAGYATGYFLRKVVKWIMIICGTILGAFFFGLLVLQLYGFLAPNSIKWDKLGNYIANTTKAWTRVNASTGSSGIEIVHSMVHNLGLPITSGLALGIIAGSDNSWKYKLTDIGEEYLRLSSQQKSRYLCKLLLEFPVVNELFLDISIDSNRVIGRKQIVELIRKYSDLTGSTLERRAQTIVSWFKWIRNNVGIVEVNDNVEIRVSRQTKIV